MAPRNNKWHIFFVVAVGVFMSTMDSSMVNIALPAIMQDFQSPLRTTEWVVLIYLLTITASLLFWGHLSDRLGRGRMYSLGLFVFALGSLACTFSPSLAILITSRFCQALGAGMMMSTGPAVIKETFPPDQLGRGLGMIGIAVSLGLMTGPTIGGFLVEFYSWRAIFLITVPVGLVFSLIAGRLLPKAPKHETPSFDWTGGAKWALSLTIISLAINYATAPEWSPSILALLLLLAFLSCFFFIKQESVSPRPLLPLHLLSKRFFNTAILSAVLSFIVLFSVIMLTPFYLDRILKLPASRIGLIMMAVPSTVMLIAPIAGWASDQIGSKILTTAGLLLSSAGLLLMTTITPFSRPVEVAARLALIGCGQALFLSPNSASLLVRVPNTYAGTAAALLATARNLGMLLGIAQSSLVFSLFFSKLTNGLDMKDFSAVHTDPFMAALHSAYFAAAVTGLIGAIVSWMREN